VLLSVFMVMVYFNVRQLRQMSLEKLEVELRPLRKFIPNNVTEFIPFILIAFTAGICEELLIEVGYKICSLMEQDPCGLVLYWER